MRTSVNFDITEDVEHSGWVIQWRVNRRFTQVVTIRFITASRGDEVVNLMGCIPEVLLDRVTDEEVAQFALAAIRRTYPVLGDVLVSLLIEQRDALLDKAERCANVLQVNWQTTGNPS